MKPYILYLHGFNSSPESRKAKLTQQWFQKNRPSLGLEVPKIPFSPKDAISYITQLYFSELSAYPAGIIGSSLGGYYALYLSVIHEIKAVLINPAVKPYNLLRDYLGKNTNLYTGETYQLESWHMDELLSLKVSPPLKDQQILTLLQTGDQTLDYREAATLLNNQPLWITPGGSHEFDNFESKLSAILAHFCL